jgi:biotin--protein ligase
MIAVYNGEGVAAKFKKILVASLSPHPVRLLSANALISSSWEKECRLLILPGGRDRPYHRDLKGEGNRKIKRFVEQGGSYLGICAGAYYAAASVAFDLGGPLEVNEARELSLFPGEAVGPLAPFCYNDPSRERLISLGEASVLYYGGPTFPNAPAESVLYRYPSGLPAILSFPFGRGLVLLSGPHVEVPVQGGQQELFASLLNRALRSNTSLQ